MADRRVATDIVIGEREKDEVDQFLPYGSLARVLLLPSSQDDSRFRLLQSQRNLAASGVFVVDPRPLPLEIGLLPTKPRSGLSPVLGHVPPGRPQCCRPPRFLLFYRYHGDANFFVVNPACNEARMIPISCSSGRMLPAAAQRLGCEVPLTATTTSSANINLCAHSPTKAWSPACTSSASTTRRPPESGSSTTSKSTWDRAS